MFDRFVARPVFTRKGAIYVGLRRSTSKRTLVEKSRLNWREVVITAPRQILAPALRGQLPSRRIQHPPFK
jgi:hypothetical protein